MANGMATSGERVGRALKHNHVCPWWLGYFLIFPLRRLLEDPEKMLVPLVKPGMRVLDFGPGMGYFSLPLARLVGPDGRVVCVDMQEEMLRGLARRARRQGLLGRIETVLAAPGVSPLVGQEGSFDLALAMHVIHEVSDAEGVFSLLAGALKPGGRLAFVEPRGHVSAEAFAEELLLAERAGLRQAGPIAGYRKGHAILLEKPNPPLAL